MTTDEKVVMVNGKAVNIEPVITSDGQKVYPAVKVTADASGHEILIVAVPGPAGTHDQI